LLQQAFKEVFEKQMEEVRLRSALKRIQEAAIRITHPKQFTPFSFPIGAVGSNRSHISSEQLEDSITKMQQQLIHENCYCFKTPIPLLVSQIVYLAGI
jgi:ATP-dependent Lhr-like helicase